MIEEEYIVGSVADSISKSHQSSGTKKKPKSKETDKSIKLFEAVSWQNRNKKLILKDVEEPKDYGWKLANKEAGKLRIKAKTMGLSFKQLQMMEMKDEQENPTEVKTSTTIADKNKPKAKDLEKEMRTIFVGNFPKECTKKDLMKLCKKYGIVESARLRGCAPAKASMLKKVAINTNQLHPERSSLIGYVRFQTLEEAKSAMDHLNGTVLREHHLRVDLAHKKCPKDKLHDNSKAVFLGNLHLKLEDDEVWNFFKDCGEIESVRLIRDAYSGLGKGIGYVNFCDQSSVQNALKMNGKELKSRPLRVLKAIKKPKKAKSHSVTQSSDRSDKTQPSTSCCKNESPNNKQHKYSGITSEKAEKAKWISKDELKKAKIVRHLTGVPVKSQKKRNLN